MGNNMMNFSLRTSLGVVLALCVATMAQAAGWGSLKGKFVVDGAAPKAAAIDASKDAFCVSQHPVDETVMVGKDGALGDVVVFLRVGAGKTVDVHPDYAAGKDQPVEIDNKGCSFQPHIALVRTGQPFVVKNSDKTGHNTNATMQKNGNFNALIAAGDEKKMTFAKAEPFPMPVSCNIHPFMHGAVLVKDDPYMAISAADGTFEIKNIPAGKQEFVFWQEVKGNLKDLKFNGGSTSKQGRAELTIEDGKTLDLCDIKVPTSALQ
jgi:plastocyanin